MEGSSLDVLGRLLPPLLLMVGALLFVRWWSRRSNGIAPSQQIRVSSRTGLARGALVAVVEVESRRLLVGVTEHGVNLITELEPASVQGMDGGDVLDFAGRDVPQATIDRPRTGLVDRLRDMTVRSQSTGPIRVPRR